MSTIPLDFRSFHINEPSHLPTKTRNYLKDTETKVLGR